LGGAAKQKLGPLLIPFSLSLLDIVLFVTYNSYSYIIDQFTRFQRGRGGNSE
jgi:hypothetical protein